MLSVPLQLSFRRKPEETIVSHDEVPLEQGAEEGWLVIVART